MPPKVESKIIDGLNDKPKEKNVEKADGEWTFLGKIKKSSFMITLNSQRARSRVTPEFEKKFRVFNDFLFKGNHILKYLVCKRCAAGECKGHNNCVMDVNILTKLEYGGKFHRLHSHASMEVVHCGSVQVDIQKIKQLAYKFFGYRLYISVRGAADVAYSRDRYLQEQEQELGGD